MRTAMAYFAGAGTVIAAIGIGLGGGLTIANVLSPHQDKPEQTRLEQRMAATKPIPPSTETDQAKTQPVTQAANTATDTPQAEQGKAPVPYVAATNAATANAPAGQTQPQTQAAAPQSSPQPAEAKVANDQPAKAAEPPAAKPQAAPREQASTAPEESKASAPEDANATARDSDLKRLAAEKRKAQRRQQWADRKAKALQQRDAEQRDADANARYDGPGNRDGDGPRIVRRDNDGPRIVIRQDDDDFDRHGDSDRRRDVVRRGPDRPFGFPGFNLFGGDRDD